MKSKVLFCMAVFGFLFAQQLVAQDVLKVLKDKEERQVLYYSIINNDERFGEFMESVKASGRAAEGVQALEAEEQEAADQALLKQQQREHQNQLMMDQMLSLMEDMVAKDPDFEKVIEERYPQVGELLRNGRMEL